MKCATEAEDPFTTMRYIGGWPDFDVAIKSLINKQSNIFLNLNIF